MRRRKDEFGRAESQWARRQIFTERRRRRVPWKSLLLIAAVGALGFALSDTDNRNRLRSLWSETTAPAPAATLPEPTAEVAATPAPVASGRGDALALPPAPER